MSGRRIGKSNAGLESSASTPGVNKPKTRSVACLPCRKRKVKCPGGNPCPNCVEENTIEHCVYAPRDRKVRISRRYIEKLVNENEQLHRQSETPPATVAGSSEETPGTGGDEETRNPLLDERPWFFRASNLSMPAHIGEVADSAFATRFRQALSTDKAEHILRTHYYPDDQLISLSFAECPLPIPSRARFLVAAALRHVGPCFYMVNENDVTDRLSLLARDPSLLDIGFMYKLWILFALGELYTSRGYGGDISLFPGVRYFAQATRILSVPSERPNIDAVETRLLLALYYLALNRRHSAGLCASSAIRIGTGVGMHLNISEAEFDSPASRQHRIRIWWTAFVADRMWSSQTGQPVSIEEDRIEVELPSNERLSDQDCSSLGNVAVQRCSIGLAKLSSRVLTTLYSRNALSMPFSVRVQNILRDLRSWSQDLPPELCLSQDIDHLPSMTPSVLYLHLSFNQCIILATRPLLLRTFQMLKSQAPSQTPPHAEMPATVRGLADTCLQCARHSYRLLSSSWIDVSFALFDYFCTQYLYSACLILAISSLMPSAQQQEDRDSYENAVDILRQLRDSGSFVATDYCIHLDAIKVKIVESQTGVGEAVQPQGGDGAVGGFGTTGEMALSDPFILEFLAQSHLDVGFIDPSIYDENPGWNLMPPGM